jgi:protocatechuate 3,4-dioxygenase beta subunit
MRRLLGWLALSVVVAVVPAMAQSVNGNLFFTVTDEQGNAIEGAKVVAQGADFARTLTTDSGGRARFIDVYPGKYDVTVSMDGYNTMILRGRPRRSSRKWS